MFLSVGTLLGLFPTPILGVILFPTGVQLALGACDIPQDKGEHFAVIVTAALAIWNVGIAFAVGMAVYWLNKTSSRHHHYKPYAARPGAIVKRPRRRLFDPDHHRNRSSARTFQQPVE
jgi:hypothetical protein